MVHGLETMKRINEEACNSSCKVQVVIELGEGATKREIHLTPNEASELHYQLDQMFFPEPEEVEDDPVDRGHVSPPVAMPTVPWPLPPSPYVGYGQIVSEPDPTPPGVWCGTALAPTASSDITVDVPFADEGE